MITQIVNKTNIIKMSSLERYNWKVIEKLLIVKLLLYKTLNMPEIAIKLLFIINSNVLFDCVNKLHSILVSCCCKWRWISFCTCCLVLSYVYGFNRLSMLILSKNYVYTEIWYLHFLLSCWSIVYFSLKFSISTKSWNEHMICYFRNHVLFISECNVFKEIG